MKSKKVLIPKATPDPLQTFTFSFVWGSVGIEARTFTEAIELLGVNLPLVNMRSCNSIRRAA